MKTNLFKDTSVLTIFEILLLKISFILRWKFYNVECTFVSNRNAIKFCSKTEEYELL